MNVKIDREEVMTMVKDYLVYHRTHHMIARDYGIHTITVTNLISCFLAHPDNEKDVINMLGSELTRKFLGYKSEPYYPVHKLRS